MIYITQAFFWLVPTVALVGFIVSLVMYVCAKRKNKRVPGSYSEETLKARKITFIVFSSIAGAMLAAVIALVILLYMAVAYM